MPELLSARLFFWFYCFFLGFLEENQKKTKNDTEGEMKGDDLAELCLPDCCSFFCII